MASKLPDLSTLDCRVCAEILEAYHKLQSADVTQNSSRVEKHTAEDLDCLATEICS